jgi:hypothetical protein
MSFGDSVDNNYQAPFTVVKFKVDKLMCQKVTKK